MNELMEKVDNLIDTIDNSKQVKDIKNINEKIMQDKELLDLIKRYNETYDEGIKEMIINNKLFSEYKHKETELNILILEINSRLKEINSKGKCSL